MKETAEMGDNYLLFCLKGSLLVTPLTLQVVIFFQYKNI